MKRQHSNYQCAASSHTALQQHLLLAVIVSSFPSIVSALSFSSPSSIASRQPPLPLPPTPTSFLLFSFSPLLPSLLPSCSPLPRSPHSSSFSFSSSFTITPHPLPSSQLTATLSLLLEDYHPNSQPPPSSAFLYFPFPSLCFFLLQC